MGFQRVEVRRVAVHHQLSVELIGARLGEDLDAAVAELVVLGGKRILIDANLADRGLRREAVRP